MSKIYGKCLCPYLVSSPCATCATCHHIMASILAILQHLRSPHGIKIMHLSLPHVNISSILHQFMRELLTRHGGLFDQIWSNGLMIQLTKWGDLFDQTSFNGFIWSILIINDFIFFFCTMKKEVFYNWGCSLIFELQ